MVFEIIHESFSGFLVAQPIAASFQVVLVLVAVVLLLPILVLLLECLGALLPNPRAVCSHLPSRPRIAILVPAHNEATGIAATLDTLLPQVNQGDRLIVIADNCSDGTAEIARAAGAMVLERQDQHQRGKGYALDFGLNWLATDPPDVVVMVDADCTVAAGAVESIANLAIAHGRPVQAVYLLSQPNEPTPKAAISSLAFTVKNLVRPLGLYRFRLPCLLTGTGMAFPWIVLNQISLASGNIVEDMQLALDLAIAGYPPLLCPEARVTGALPQQAHAAKSQRTRWEHGHLQTLFTQVPRLLGESLRQQRLDLLAIALDLCVPPLSLLVLLWVLAIAIAAGAGLFGVSQLPLLLLAIAGLLLLTAIGAAWAKFCRHTLPLRSLLAIPFYILWKIPLYLTFLIRPQTQWVRTDRD
jgi:cellulose synthase/poly-beta-1,6-N-acetylglucosamine synthase-like glycosyltransferase